MDATPIIDLLTYLDFDCACEACPRYQGPSPWALLAAVTEAVSRDAEAFEGRGAVISDGADVAGRLADIGKTIGFISVYPGALYP